MGKEEAVKGVRGSDTLRLYRIDSVFAMVLVSKTKSNCMYECTHPKSVQMAFRGS